MNLCDQIEESVNRVTDIPTIIRRMARRVKEKKVPSGEVSNCYGYIAQQIIMLAPKYKNDYVVLVGRGKDSYHVLITDTNGKVKADFWSGTFYPKTGEYEWTGTIHSVVFSIPVQSIINNDISRFLDKPQNLTEGKSGSDIGKRLVGRFSSDLKKDTDSKVRVLARFKGQVDIGGYRENCIIVGTQHVGKSMVGKIVYPHNAVGFNKSDKEFFTIEDRKYVGTISAEQFLDAVTYITDNSKLEEETSNSLEVIINTAKRRIK